MTLPEPVRNYLDLLIDAYSGEATPDSREVDLAWAAVPLDWRMRIHEKIDHEDREKVLSSAREMLGLDEVPELGPEFFESAILTRPGEDILEAVKGAKP